MHHMLWTNLLADAAEFEASYELGEKGARQLSEVLGGGVGQGAQQADVGIPAWQNVDIFVVAVG